MEKTLYLVLLLLTMQFFFHFSEGCSRKLFSKSYNAKITAKESITIFDMLQANKILLKDAQDFSHYIQKEYQLQNLKPGQSVSITIQKCNEKIALKKLLLNITPQKSIFISKEANSFHSKITINSDIKKTLVRINTKIKSSPSEIAALYNMPPEVLNNIVSIEKNLNTGSILNCTIEVFVDKNGKIIGYGDILRVNTKYRYQMGLNNVEFLDIADISNLIEKSTIESFQMPIPGASISSNFGFRIDPITGVKKLHKGVDFRAKIGTPIIATRSGKIDYIGNNGGYGKFIRISHDDGYKTAYAHMSKYNPILKIGSKIKKGNLIGYSGNTGRSTGPHLHYEVIYNNKHIDPLLAHQSTAFEKRDLQKFRDFKMQVKAIKAAELKAKDLRSGNFSRNWKIKD